MARSTKNVEEARERQAFNQAELERMKWFLEDMKELRRLKENGLVSTKEHTRLSRYNDIIDSCQKAREALTEADYSALELVDSAISAIGDVSDVDAKLEKIYTQLNDAREIIDSASDDVEHYLDRTDFDEAVSKTRSKNQPLSRIGSQISCRAGRALRRDAESLREGS